MCGFAGFVTANKIDKTVLIRMADSIAHRGPDDSGIWHDATTGIGLAHRRLSILDLSPAGHQPMHAVSGRFVIAFNGEIYNHPDLRKQLSPSPDWRGHSDTETLLACIEQWGLEKTLRACTGMFALALWDRKERTLALARDRMGEKPLYYGWQNGVFLFGSELKALRVHPSFAGEINRDALALLLRHNYIPTPYSIYKNIHKLQPGTILTVPADRQQTITGNLPEVRPYWSLSDHVTHGQENPFTGSDEEAVGTLDTVLRSAVSGQMMADVPLGAFLSGGIDSSAIVALMQEQSARPVKTFSIGFHEKGYNEAHYAKEVAQHLGTDHTELYISPKEAMDIIPKLPTLYDEPFSDSSQIPTCLVSQMTREHVTVSLSGDAGDELFGGYNRYFWTNSLWKKIGWMPAPARKLAANAMTAASPEALNSFFGKLSPVMPSRLQVSRPGDKLHKLANILGARTPEDIYRGLVSHWKRPSNIVIGATEPQTILTDHDNWPQLDFESSMMYLDSLSYLPDDILAKVDRAAMGVSLETRVPFLDHNVVEFAWHLPLSLKLRNGEGKWILRQVLYKYVPQKMIDRPKMGFGVPIDSWLRGPLRDWAENLLDETRLQQEGFFNPAPIREKWKEHLSGERNWQYLLWDILMFQAWLEEQEDIK